MPDILPVPRTGEEARRVYDRLSRFYGYTVGALGRRYSQMALRRLSIAEGETVLEIGFGTGYCLEVMAKLVGEKGRACGVDISPGMIGKTRRRLEKAGLQTRVELCCGDATCLPYAGEVFDAVFMSFALEVLDTPQIPEVLAEVKRVLKPGGRLGAACMSKERGESAAVRVYEWAHKRCPMYIASRPIYAERALRDAGYRISDKESLKIFGLPAEIIVAAKARAGGWSTNAPNTEHRQG